MKRTWLLGIAAVVAALPLCAGTAFALLGDVIGSNDFGQGKMRWALDTNTVVWSIGGGTWPNTVGFNGTDVFHLQGDNSCQPLPINRIDASTGAILSSFTLDGAPGGVCTHIEDLAFSTTTDLWGADIFNNRLVRWDITTGTSTLQLPITGSFSDGVSVSSPTGIASTPLGMYASMGWLAGHAPEIGIIDTTTGVYTPVFVETIAPPYAYFYIHSLAYDSARGVLWENLSYADPNGTGTAQVLRQRFLDGTSAGPDIVLDPSPVNSRFDGFEHFSPPVPQFCGNGTVDPGEQCDDGNNVNGDGCSAECTIEAPVCGNGILDAGEQCDDGNTTNGDGCSATCQIENKPPVCSAATASPASLWPPNHQMVSISILGVTDPDGNPVTITATSVFQDERVKATGTGSGNTSPDATLSPLAVRAERDGNPKTPGNGRVYHINFTADDGRGGTCNGSVTVCVPHDQRPSGACVDGGSLYNSTIP